MENLFKRLLEFTDTGIYRYTFNEGKIIMANRGFVKILNLDLKPEAIAGKHLKELLRYTEKEGTVRKALEESGEIHNFEYHFKTLKGEDKWVLHDSYIVIDPETNEKLVEATVRDITSRKMMENLVFTERERLDVMLESIGDAVIATDHEGKILIINSVAQKLTGYAKSEAMGRSLVEIFNIINEVTRIKCDNPVEKVLQTGKVVGLANHTALISKDGTERSIADSGAPIKDKSGKIIGVILVFRDVTDERTIEKALKDSETTYREVFNSTNDMILIQDLKTGEIIDVNPKVEEMSHYTKHELIKMGVAGFTPQDPEMQKKIMPLVMKAAQGEPQTFEWTFISKEGILHPTEVSLKNANINGVPRLLANVRDITERKRAEEEAKRYTSSLESLNSFSIELAEETKDNIFDQIAKKLRAITNATTVSVSLYDKNSKALVIQNLITEAGIINQINKYLGKNIIGMKIPLTEANYKLMIDETTSTSRSLYELTFGAIPKPVADSLQKVLGIGNLLGLAFHRKNELIGACTISIPENLPMPSRNFLKLFTNIAAVSIQRKLAEDKILNLNSLLQMISQINQLIIKEKDKKSLLDSACKILTRTKGYCSAWIDVANEFTPSLEPVAACGVDIETLKALNLKSDKSKDGKNPSGICINSKEFYKSIDVSADPNLKILKGSLPCEAKVLISAPISINNKVFGSLNVTSENTDSFNEQETALIKELAEDLGFAIQHINLVQMLEDSEKKYSLVVDKSMDGILILQDGLVKFTNNALANIGNYTQDDLLGKPFTDFIVPSFRPLVLSRYSKRMKGEVIPSLYEIEIYTKNGATLPVEINSSLISFENKPAILSIMRDITERKRADKAKDEFVRTVSHELRTPISIAKESVSQVLDGLHGEINEKQKGTLSTSIKNIDRLCRLVNNLLDISKIEAGKVELDREEINIIEIAKGAIESMSPKAKTKKLKIQERFKADKLKVFADKEKVMEIFCNLIDNAIKFTEKGQIEVSISDKTDFVECSIKDTGIGIKKKDFPRVFNKFEQFGRTAGPGEKGTGLGLAIVKSFIGLHGGEIKMESEEGKGSTFIFTIPKQLPKPEK